MKRFLTGIRAADLRLGLAVAACLVLFVATPTTSDSSTCGASKGTVVVNNQSSVPVRVGFSGPESITVTVDSEASSSVSLKAGQYAWTATASQGAGSMAGSVTVTKNKSSTVIISL